MIRNPRVWLGALVVAGLLPALPARAQEKLAAGAEAVKYLPNDTEVLFTVNIRQMLDSALVKKNDGVDKIRALLKGNQEVNQILTSLEFDPLKDVATLTVAGPGGTDPEKGLLILNGKFNLAKFQKKAEEVAKDHGDILKITPQGKYKVWELTPPNLPPNINKINVVLVNPTTMLAATGDDSLKEALAKVDGKKKTELKKEVTTLLEGTDPKQSMYFLALGSALAKGDFPNAEMVKPILEQLKTISVGVTLTDDIKAQVGIGTKDVASANKLRQGIERGLLAAPALFALAAMNNEQVAPFVDIFKDIVKTIKTTRKGTMVTIKGEVSKEMIDKIEKAAKMAQGGQ
jgi:hypothetical protein